jgi:hypothetical protein
MLVENDTHTQIHKRIHTHVHTNTHTHMHTNAYYERTHIHVYTLVTNCMRRSARSKTGIFYFGNSI